MMLLSPDALFWIAAVFLAAASFFDLRTGEVPEKLSRSFIVLMLAFASMETFLTMQLSYLGYSAVLGACFFLFGCLMFYLGEWGGGDVKILAGVGCCLGLLAALGGFDGTDSIIPFYVDYFINFALVATPYVLAYTFALGLLKPEVFRGFSKNMVGKMSIILILISFLPAVFSIVLEMYKLAFVYLLVPLLVVLTFYLKAVEDIALQKTIPVGELRAEDILASDLVVDGKRIASKRDAGGLSEKQVKDILSLSAQGKVPQNISVRWGIRFIPVFFLAFLLTYLASGTLQRMVAYLMLS